MRNWKHREAKKIAPGQEFRRDGAKDAKPGHLNHGQEKIWYRAWLLAGVPLEMALLSPSQIQNSSKIHPSREPVFHVGCVIEQAGICLWVLSAGMAFVCSRHSLGLSPWGAVLGGRTMSSRESSCRPCPGPGGVMVRAVTPSLSSSVNWGMD